MKQSSVAVLLVVLLQSGCTPRAAKPVGPGQASRPLDVYWVDVEGGAATLIVTPAGESVLIDSGFPGERDAGRIFHIATKVAGLQQIDHLITTHYHQDHFGGAATLATLMPIRHVHDNGLFKEGWEKPSPEYLQFEAKSRTVLGPGDDVPLTQRGRTRLRLQCLAARQKFVEPSAAATPNDDCGTARRQRPDYSDNANSIVLLLSFGDFRLFDGGDLTWNNELKLVCPVKLVPTVDVYQVTHHGQATSNPPELVRALAPTVAVINNGPRKGGQPPTFETLKATPSLRAIYQVHRNVKAGEESANTEDEFIANLEEKCQGNYIKMSVAPDGVSYTITIPATGHRAHFRRAPRRGHRPALTRWSPSKV